MDKMLAFYTIGAMALSIIGALIILFGMMKLIFAYIREPWWAIASIFPTLIAIAMIVGILYFFLPVLAQIGVLP